MMLQRSLGALVLSTSGFLALQSLTTPAQALTTVCTPSWTSITAPGPASATLAGPTPPCPATATTVSINNVRTGPAGGNAFSDNWGATIASNFPTTTNTGIGIGNGLGYQITFSQTVTDPYLYFNYFDPSTYIDFLTQPIQLVQASNAVLVPGTSRIDPSGASDQITDGFVVRVLGTFGSSTPVVFDDVATAFNDSVAFTAGVAAAPVPGPLPLMGAGMAFAFSRRLRRRLRDNATTASIRR